MPLPVLAAMGISAGLRALGGVLGGRAKAKQAKADAANQNLLMADRRTLDQKQLDRRRKIIQRLQKYYASSKLLGTRNGEDLGFGNFMGDMGPEVGAEAYQLPAAPTMEAGSPGFWSNLATGAVGGVTDYLGQPAQGPVPQYGAPPQGVPEAWGRDGDFYRKRPGSTTAALSSFEAE